MIRNRKKTEEFIIKQIDTIAPGGFNKKLYEDLFAKMSNKEFEDFMFDLQKKKITLSIIMPNTEKSTLDIDRNIKIAKELGYDFFQRIKFTGNKDLPDYITPNKYLVFSLPIRRAAQLLSKKISIPSDDKTIDLTTGQVTGDSKGSKLTMPEIQVLTGMGLKHSIVELLRDRGGDLGAKNAMSTLLFKQGSVSQATLAQYATGVVSTKTLSTYLKAMHIANTLTQK